MGIWEKTHHNPEWYEDPRNWDPEASPNQKRRTRETPDRTANRLLYQDPHDPADKAPEYGDDIAGERRRLGGEAGRYRGYGADALAGQEYTLEEYRKLIEGKGPSIAELQRGRGQSQATAGALQALAQSRGGNLASSGTAAAGISAANAMQGNADAAMLRATEQLAATDAYGNLSSAMRDQAMTGEMGYEGLMADANKTQADIDAEWYAELRRQQLEEQRFRHERNMNRIGAAGRVIGSALQAFASDERAKQDIRPVTMASSQSDGQRPGDIKDPWPAPQPPKPPPGDIKNPWPNPPQSAADRVASMRAIQPIAFRYKPGIGVPGQQVGVSAQNVASTPIGRDMVVRRPDGLLGIRPDIASGTALAASADQQQQIDAIRDELRRAKIRRGEEDTEDDGQRGAGMGAIYSRLAGSMGGSR